MRRVVVLVAVLAVVGASCSTSGGGGGGGGTGPPCTGDIELPSDGPIAPRVPPTILDDLPTDLQLETPGFGLDTFDFGPSILANAPADISADGTKLLLRTEDQGAVPGGFFGDVAWIVRDRTTGTNSLVMPERFAGVWNTAPWVASFLPDGSVAFTAQGYWLPNDDGGGREGLPLTQIFRWDIDTHEYTPLSLGPDDKPIGVVPGQGIAPVSGPENPRVSADGRHVFFVTKVPLGDEVADPPTPDAGSSFGGVEDLFRRDTVTGEVVKINVGNHPELGALANSGASHIIEYEVSADGNFVAFESPATGGLAEDGYCGWPLIFLRDIAAGTTTLVSHDNHGNQRFGHGVNISADGRYVTYGLSKWNTQYGGALPGPGMSHLPGVGGVIWDRLTDTTGWALPRQDGTPSSGPGGMQPDGNLFLRQTRDDGAAAEGIVPGDGDGKWEVLLYDLAGNTIRKLSQTPDGTNLWPGYDWPTGQAIYPFKLTDDGTRLFFETSRGLLPEDTDGTGDVYSMAVN